MVNLGGPGEHGSGQCNSHTTAHVPRECKEGRGGAQLLLWKEAHSEGGEGNEVKAQGDACNQSRPEDGREIDVWVELGHEIDRVGHQGKAHHEKEPVVYLSD